MNIIACSNNLYNKTNLFAKKDIIFIKDKKALTLKSLQKIQPQYIFFPHWSHIIPANIYENFNCIIFHMTDLPFGRGGSPLQNLIERGFKKTKISAIKCVKELDSGHIYLKRDLDISFGSAQEIYQRAGNIVAEMIDEIIANNPTPQPQMGEIVVFKRRIPAQSNIKDLTTLSKVYDYIRMLDADGYPKAFLENKGLKFEFTNANFVDNKVIANVKISTIKGSKNES